MKGAYACDRATFERTIKSGGVDPKRVTIIPGWFDESLAKPRPFGDEKAALVWIDCDLYASTVPALSAITPYLQEGTVIAFDDWFCYRANPQKGEQKAVAEWLEEHKEIQLIPYRTFSWHGNSFIVQFRHQNET